MMPIIHGMQALVQFARDADAGLLHYALKYANCPGGHLLCSHNCSNVPLRCNLFIIALCRQYQSYGSMRLQKAHTSQNLSFHC